MRIGSTLFFIVAVISVSETINITTRAIDGDRVWSAFWLAVEPLVTSVTCSYVGFR
jgi:hypothetical protein